MKTVLRKAWGPALSVILFSAAAWLLYREFRTYHLSDILHALEILPAGRIWLGLGLTALSYAVMTGYDALALHYIQFPLAYPKIGLASFSGYAFSNNIGLSMIAGASVRYRLYSAWGLSALQITQIVAFTTLTLWLGFFSLGGFVFLIEPLHIPALVHLPLASLRLIGTFMLALVLVYALLCRFKKTPFRIRGLEFGLPAVRLMLFQLTLAALDWVLASLVLYVLVAPGQSVSYAGFLGVFLFAQLAGLASQVPGGLGVFETVIILMLSSRLPAHHLLGALMAYRVLYYWLPLGLAALLIGLQEILRKRRHVLAFAALFDRWVSPLIPHILGFTAFIGGGILLLSGATPAIDLRLHWLRQVVPLPFIELSHFIGSITGMGLLLLGRGLQRRLDAAYHLAIGLLSIGIVASLLKGIDYEEALALLLILAAILPSRRHFYRKASLFSQRFDAGWIAAIVIFLGGSIWLGLYAYRHVEYADNLWWRFALSGNAPRFLRATVGAVTLGLFFALRRLLRAAPPIQAEKEPQDLQKAAPVVRNVPEAAAHLALLGDKRFLFSPQKNAFIMYAIEGHSWIAMGDPVGPGPEWPELLWKFRELSDRYGERVVFYEVGHEHLHLYLDLGLSMLKLGEEARIALDTFSLEGSARKGLRYTQNRLQKEGCRFEVLLPGEAAFNMNELKGISDAWLAEKHTREKRFSLGFFNPEYLAHCPLARVICNAKTVAFANLWLGGGREELSIDLMRYLPEAPAGVMEYLFIQVMRWGKAEGYRWFNLGMAPLSGLEDRALAPLWNRLGAFVFRYGEHFYNFQGLRQYKEKFDPQWRPKYLAAPGGLALPQILGNIASLISGDIKGVVAK